MASILSPRYLQADTAFASRRRALLLHPPISPFPPAKPPLRTSRCKSDRRPPPSTSRRMRRRCSMPPIPCEASPTTRPRSALFPISTAISTVWWFLHPGPRRPSIHAEGSSPQSMARRPARSTPMADAPSPLPLSSTIRTRTTGSSAVSRSQPNPRPTCSTSSRSSPTTGPRNTA